MNRPGHEAGSASVLTVVLFTPIIVVLLGFVSFAGRITAARNDVNAAARDAARAASIQTDRQAGAAAAEQTTRAALGDRNVTCAELRVSTVYRPLTVGDMVQVTVSCTVGLRDLVGLGLPGNRVVVAVGYEPLDRYRGNGT